MKMLINQIKTGDNMICILVILLFGAITIGCILWSAVYLAKNRDIYVDSSGEEFKLLYNENDVITLRNIKTKKVFDIDLATFSRDYKLKTFEL